MTLVSKSKAAVVNDNNPRIIKEQQWVGGSTLSTLRIFFKTFPFKCAMEEDFEKKKLKYAELVVEIHSFHCLHYTYLL